MKKRLILFLVVILSVSCSSPFLASPTATPAATPTMTSTPTMAPTPTPGLGSTWIRQADAMVMVYVPAGEFIMGMDADIAVALCVQFDSYCEPDWFMDMEPIHSVYLDAYWIDQTEVTNDMFGQFVAATGYETEAEQLGGSRVSTGPYPDYVTGADWQHPFGPDSDLAGLGSHPVVNVSWNDATAYCTWAEARLPSEAEWEKAARSADERVYPWGNQDPSGSLANLADVNLQVNRANPNVDDGYEFTAPVGSYPAGASPYGALDMIGNVYEWVNDWRGEAYYSQSPERNPQGPASGTERMRRGGAWWSNWGLFGSAYRTDWGNSSDRTNYVGFRCALGTIP